MLDLHSRRLERARRRAENFAAENAIPISELPTAEELLASAEASRSPWALSGIGRLNPKFVLAN